MIKNLLFTGDCHGQFYKFKSLDEKYKTDETAIIILGDVGVNYYNDKRDLRSKKELLQYGDYRIYCIRGNHDRNPKELNYEMYWDDFVNNWVYIDPNFEQLRYFPMWGTYNICGYNVGVIGGAYSVDKFYRLSQGWNWFEDEQMSNDDFQACKEHFKNKSFDIILSHTCPYNWMPTDLFLSFVDQTTVDNTTEYRLQTIAKYCNWNYWLWGHYHADRFYRDTRRFMLMDTFISLNEIINNESIMINKN